MNSKEYPPREAPGEAQWMREALGEAALALGRTSPNPPVGCLIVHGGEVVGRGFHPRAGEPHAEVFALREAGERARGGTAYVTLEPCSHFGRTPPCAGALIRAGVRRVVVAAQDPHPQVSGRGLEQLRAAGIEVEVGLLEAEATRQQAGFRSLVARGRPHVIYKYAATLDGKVAALTPAGTGEANGPVSGPEARARVMRWRDECDAIAVGAGTVLTDDPRLTTRGVPGGRDPRPVVFDRRGRVPPGARALRAGSVLVTGPPTDPRPFEERGVHVICAESLADALRELGALHVSTLLLEGGPGLASAFLDAGLIDEVRAFITPKLLGAGLSPLQGPGRSMHAAQALEDLRVELVGNDILVSGSLRV